MKEIKKYTMSSQMSEYDLNERPKSKISKKMSKSKIEGEKIRTESQL